MKPEELRIGNLLLFYGRVIHINAINIQDFQNELNGQVNEVNYQPIPLIEEWLIKFGFDKAPSYLFIDRLGMIKYDMNDCSWCFTHTYYPKIKSVHQLQNLYFALTGEELTIKELVK